MFVVSAVEVWKHSRHIWLLGQGLQHWHQRFQCLVLLVPEPRLDLQSIIGLELVAPRRVLSTTYVHYDSALQLAAETGQVLHVPATEESAVLAVQRLAHHALRVEFRHY